MANSIFSGNILSIIQNSELTDAKNWKTLSPKSYQMYITGILENCPYTVRTKNTTFSLNGGEALLAYGPTNKYHLLPMPILNKLEDMTAHTGKEILSAHAGKAPSFKKNGWLESVGSMQAYRYLPWTRVKVATNQNRKFYGFKCPSNWTNVSVNVVNNGPEQAFTYLLTEYGVQSLKICTGGKLDWFIVVSCDVNVTLEQALSNPAFILKQARFYDADEFSCLFDMRTYAGTYTSDYSLTCPSDEILDAEDATGSASQQISLWKFVSDRLAKHGWTIECTYNTKEFEWIRAEKIPAEITTDDTAKRVYSQLSQTVFSNPIIFKLSNENEGKNFICHTRTSAQIFKLGFGELDPCIAVSRVKETFLPFANKQNIFN